MSVKAWSRAPGQFAVRGGILDIYPLTEEMPVRIELWGDEIDSIRSFDVESQRSVENLEEIEIYPASENWTEEMETVSFLDYFPVKKTLLFLDEPNSSERKGRMMWKKSMFTADRTGGRGRDESGWRALSLYIRSGRL